MDPIAKGRRVVIVLGVMACVGAFVGLLMMVAPGLFQ